MARPFEGAEDWIDLAPSVSGDVQWDFSYCGVGTPTSLREVAFFCTPGGEIYHIHGDGELFSGTWLRIDRDEP